MRVHLCLYMHVLSCIYLNTFSPDASSYMHVVTHRHVHGCLPFSIPLFILSQLKSSNKNKFVELCYIQNTTNKKEWVRSHFFYVSFFACFPFNHHWNGIVFFSKIEKFVGKPVTGVYNWLSYFLNIFVKVWSMENTKLALFLSWLHLLRW